jgi:hypothetical protein
MSNTLSSKVGGFQIRDDSSPLGAELPRSRGGASRDRRYAGLALLLALPMSQLGHVLAYALQGLPTSGGSHAYFPPLFAALEGAAGAAVLAALLVIGAGRLVKPGWSRSGDAVSLLPLLLALGAGQLLVYLFQETLELAVAGREPSLSLVLWGLAGQAPIATLAALALRWLSQRLEPALRALAFRHSLTLLTPSAGAPRLVLQPALVTLRSRHVSSNGLRAPPSLL